MTDSKEKINTGMLIALVIFIAATIVLALATLANYGESSRKDTVINARDHEIARKTAIAATGMCGNDQMVPIQFVDVYGNQSIEYAVAGEIVSKDDLKSYIFTTDPTTSALKVSKKASPSDSVGAPVMTRPAHK